MPLHGPSRGAEGDEKNLGGGVRGDVAGTTPKVTSLRLPLQAEAMRQSGAGCQPSQDWESSGNEVAVQLTRGLSRVGARDDKPLVTCIMPTRDRVAFALNAVQLFNAQDYPCLELIVVDDGVDNRLESLLPAHPQIRYVRLPPVWSIGLKRNYACGLARGEFIAHWDDDDWYAPGRLSAQLAPLLEGKADMTGLVISRFLEIPSWRWWTVTPALRRRLFMDGVPGGTLVYRREVWERLARYPDTSLAEDAAFLVTARRRGARLQSVNGEDLFVYVRHARSTWRFTCGQFLDPSGWVPSAESALPREARRFFGSCAEPWSLRAPHRGRQSEHKARNSAGGHRALVSAIMPTRDRRELVARAIGYFERQDYRARELLVLDDGDEPVREVVPVSQRIRYIRIGEQLSVGEKRNLGCELAHGDIVVHWDDDDWYAPNRIGYQIEQLTAHGADVCGPGRLLYFDPYHDSAWLYQYPVAAEDPWVAGSGLCYRIESWGQEPFPSLDRGEDTSFVRSRRAGRTLVLDDHRFLVALLHGANTSSRVGDWPWWQRRSVQEVKAILGADYGSYLPRHTSHQLGVGVRDRAGRGVVLDGGVHRLADGTAARAASVAGSR